VRCYVIIWHCDAVVRVCAGNSRTLRKLRALPRLVTRVRDLWHIPREYKKIKTLRRPSASRARVVTVITSFVVRFEYTTTSFASRRHCADGRNISESHPDTGRTAARDYNTPRTIETSKSKRKKNAARR